MSGNEKRSDREFAAMKTLVCGCEELSVSFERRSEQSCSPQVRDELQKLAAAARNHCSGLRDALSGL